MGNIFERIKKSSVLKANAALIAGAADAAPQFQSYKTDENAPSQTPPPPPVETKEEKKDDTSVDEVVGTDDSTSNETPEELTEEQEKINKVKEKGGILGALFGSKGGPGKFASPAKSATDEIKKNMGKGFVNDEFGDVVETTKTSKGEVGDFDKEWDKEAAGGLDYADWIKLEGNKEKEDKFIDSITKPGKETKTYDVTPNVEEVTETTPGSKSNYNMSYKKALSAKMSEGVQKRDANQDMRQFNKYTKKFNKGKADGKINPATGKPFASATEYADFRMGNSAERDADGNFNSRAEYQQALNSRYGVDKEGTSSTKSEKEKYDKEKHGDKESITYSDSETTLPAKTETNTAEVTDNEKKDPPTKFTLRKKSKALKNFKYKK